MRFTGYAIVIVLAIAIANGGAVCAGTENGGKAKSRLVTIYSDELSFGTSIYPFRRKTDAALIISEARALGLTALRVEYSRDRVERSDSDDSGYNPANYNEPHQDIIDLLRSSGLDITLTLDGKRRDKQGKVQDYPRNADGSVDGVRASKGMADFTRWVVEKTGDFIRTYEMWNEAFGLVWDNPGGVKGKGFGPGGSKQNADNYASMMLPAVRIIRSKAPKAKIAIEGNYWNIERSVFQSGLYQELLKQADYAVVHPYGYKLRFYRSAEETGDKAGQIYEIMRSYPGINNKIDFMWTEYGVSAKDMGLPSNQIPDDIQAKAVLRATVLHLKNNIKHLYIFDMFYPSQPAFTLAYEGPDGRPQRRQSWHSFKRLLNAIGPGRPCNHTSSLTRNGGGGEKVLSGDISDLAIANKGGFTYLIWRETPVTSFPQAVEPKIITVKLRCSDGKSLRLAKVFDPITGETIRDARVSDSDSGGIELTLPVRDYPLICRLSTK